MQLVDIYNLYNFASFVFVEQNSTIQKPVAQHPQIPTIKTNKVTAPSVISKARTKV
jgi:hypothetical protein